MEYWDQYTHTAEESRWSSPLIGQFDPHEDSLPSDSKLYQADTEN